MLFWFVDFFHDCHQALGRHAFSSNTKLLLEMMALNDVFRGSMTAMTLDLLLLGCFCCLPILLLAATNDLNLLNNPTLLQS
jgi:hypothetical protein